ncbi:hypothetical protein L873DRAFT_1795052 [Choiromyces venosus 120613-1]|uniref:Uncharacterized protein n=1 Tax=Choiromyces venosus 120613-1 TaxID=1336337 RepID=A0A3N4J3S4_9PEZI|nr:hypothetical protein L873DRAFT_1795052 [Choiromyces venosus 120613-1]
MLSPSTTVIIPFSSNSATQNQAAINKHINTNPLNTTKLILRAYYRNNQLKLLPQISPQLHTNTPPKQPRPPGSKTPEHDLTTGKTQQKSENIHHGQPSLINQLLQPKTAAAERPNPSTYLASKHESSSGEKPTNHSP